MRLIIGIVALALAAFMVQNSPFMSAVVAMFGVASIVISTKERIVMTVNRDGFFYYGDLITNWTNFVSARFMDQTPQVSSTSLGISDQFFLAIRYYKENEPGCFERKFALTNTQDKSEEEIMAAIRFYYNQSQIGV
ncbi:MAG TPA: hypothetical protein VFT06_01680 [Flavisolibacter sp.]|nr:hypothetical protein [Flavisolibacter sp.]